MTASARNVATVGADVPAVCLIADVLRLLNLSRSTFDRRIADGSLALIELTPLGRLRRFTGASVQAAMQRTRWTPSPSEAAYVG
jgi:hypothetical protein